MKLEIKYKGNGKEYFINDREIHVWRASQMLTGTENQRGDGIFETYTCELFFQVEGNVKSFTFDELPDSTDGEVFKKEILTRIKAVRKWVDSLKTGEIVMEVEE